VVISHGALRETEQYTQALLDNYGNNTRLTWCDPWHQAEV